METKYQTSFIPKKPVAVVGQSSSHGTSLFLVISIIIFLVSIGIGGYVYLSKNILIQQIEANQQKIEANKSGVISDTSEVENLVALSSRINIAKQLLDKHVSIYPIFDFLQQGTLKSVRFKNFSFTSNGKNDSGISTVSIQLTGQARDWETVASQADEFGKPEWRNIINEPKMSNLSLGADGSISFTFTAQVSPGALVYKSAN